MKKNILYLIFILLNCSVIFSQNDAERYTSLQTEFFYGKPLEHDKKLENAVQGNSYGFLLSWNNISNEENNFNKLYNYPERGYSFLYQNFNSTVLGEVYGGYRHYTYNLTPKKNNPLKLTTAFGVGYATKAYDAINNPENFAHGSKLLVSAYLKLNYFKYFKNSNFSFNTGVSLVHFSNMSFKNPNLGINTVSLNLGLNYRLQPVKINKTLASETSLKTNYPINYNLILRGGYNESLITDSGLYPFYTITAYASKKLTNYSTITSGVDFFDSKFLKNYIKNKAIEDGENYNEKDYRRAGIFIGHELTQNNFAFVSQLGYTFYYPFPYVGRVYERFGFKYNLSKHFFSEITLKVNLFRAEGLEAGIGYKF